MTAETADGGHHILDLLAVGPDALTDRVLEPATMQAIYEDSAANIERHRSPGGDPLITARIRACGGVPRSW